jgi:luciferase family oxidoreductase group 1
VPDVTSRTVPLSVLDLAPVSSGSSSRKALADTVALARHADDLGYLRYWVAEHHGMTGVASSSPPVLIGALAAATERIRVGSGGVMLPNHAPLVVAEQFGMLEALHPGRIDLGLGRAPGTDPQTAAALRRNAEPLSADDFPQQLATLLGFFRGQVRGLTAVPAEGNEPPVWLLGSSGYSAQLAAYLGLPFAFAHHFSPAGTDQALALYRAGFRPSDALAEPYAMVCVNVLCADTPEQAQWLAAPGGLSFLRLRSGVPGPFPSPEEAAATAYSPQERAFVDERLTQTVVGDPEQVRGRLLDLLDRTQADELMVTTMAHDPADRRRSYALLAGLAAGTPLALRHEDRAAA